MKRAILLICLVLTSLFSLCQTTEPVTKLAEISGLPKARLGSHISSFTDLIPPRPRQLIIPLRSFGSINTPIGAKGTLKVRVGSIAFFGQFYSRKNDKQNFAGIKIKRITYFFLRDTLTAITIKIKNKKQVLTAIKNLSVLYGEPSPVFFNSYPVEYETDEEVRNNFYEDKQIASWGTGLNSLTAIPSNKKIVIRRSIDPSYFLRKHIEYNIKN